MTILATLCPSIIEISKRKLNSRLLQAMNLTRTCFDAKHHLVSSVQFLKWRKVTIS
jgi:hypothetical protein